MEKRKLDLSKVNNNVLQFLYKQAQKDTFEFRKELKRRDIYYKKYNKVPEYLLVETIKKSKDIYEVCAELYTKPFGGSVYRRIKEVMKKYNLEFKK